MFPMSSLSTLVCLLTYSEYENFYCNAGKPSMRSGCSAPLFGNLSMNANVLVWLTVKILPIPDYDSRFKVFLPRR